MNRTSLFFEQARNIPLSTLALRLGLQLSKDHRSATPCPACGYTVRSRTKKDRRPPIGFRTDGLGWKCQHCHEKGDGIELVAYTLGHARFRQLPGHTQAQIFEWYADQGFITHSLRTKQPFYKSTPPPPLPTLLKTLPKPLFEDLTSYPPANEIQLLWNASLPIEKEPQITAMLQRRGIGHHFISFLDLARALPPNAPQFPWTKARGIPWHQGWRLLLPAFDHTGQMKSFKARWIHPNSAPDQAKSVSPRGYQIKGLLMADFMALTLLQDAKLPITWPTQSIYHIWIVEGDMDFLGLNHALTDPKHLCHAIFGIWPGSWNQALTARFPLDPRLHFTIATDPDKAGELYATKITKMLMFRGFSLSQLHRWKP